MNQIAIAVIGFSAATVIVRMICMAFIKVKELDVTETLEKEKLYQATRAAR